MRKLFSAEGRTIEIYGLAQEGVGQTVREGRGLQTGHFHMSANFIIFPWHISYPCPLHYDEFLCRIRALCHRTYSRFLNNGGWGKVIGISCVVGLSDTDITRGNNI